MPKKTSQEIAKEIEEIEAQLLLLKDEIASKHKEKAALQRKLRRLRSNFWRTLEAEKHAKR